MLKFKPNYHYDKYSITKLKIDYAKTLLIKTNYSLLDISNMLGYSSYSHFITLFKKYTKYTPHDYRKVYYIIDKL